jgi:tetratricopeptide (TPR) repeat protein
MQPWRIAALVALAVIVLSVPYYALRQTQQAATGQPPAVSHTTFVGRDQCIECHTEAYESWLGSHHDDAMDVASEDTVVGDFDDAEFAYEGITSRFYRKGDKFFVNTEGPGGEMADFEVLYTFGVEPLQQYLVPLPGGRLQALSTAWDVERQRWFFLYPGTDIEPDDWLHWTRNGQNWNGMCAECHSTNLRKNFDAESNTFQTEWSEIDVSCEACHGPGSRHVDWARIDPMGRPAVDNYGLVVATSGLDNRQLGNICAPCHSRRAEIGDYDHSDVDLLEFAVPSLLREGLYHPDGQILEEVYVWGSFQQSKMYDSGVRCDDCHDVHSLELHQPGNDLCLQCHRADTYDDYTHHFHKKVVEGEPSDGALCVKCHMPEQPFMVIDYRADHSIRVPRPDLSLEIGVPNSCSQSGCHDNETLEWNANAYTEWYGKARKPHFGTVIAGARQGDPAAEDGLHAILESSLYPALVRATALNELIAFPGERSDAAVQRALGDEEALLRVTAVDAVTSQTPEGLVERLGPMLFDSVRAVRLRVAARLAGVGREYLRAYQREALDKELADYIDSTRRNLDFAGAGLNLANLYASQGDNALAERYYRMALEVDGLFIPAKMNLAVLVSQQGDNEEAEKLLREILADYPDQHDAAYSLALLLVGVNRMQEGLFYLGRAAAGLPQRPRVQYNYGLLLAQLSRDDEAEVALRSAADLEPESFDYLYALIEFYYRRARFDDAMFFADQMIEAHPQQRFGHDMKAAIEAGQAQGITPN